MTYSKNKGFTIIELTLSMTFISILLLAIAMMILQISSIYRKGITMREVNTAGQEIVSDLQRTLNQTSPENVELYQVDGGGRLCIGTAVYAWNYGSAIGTADAPNRYSSGSSSEATDIRFVKVIGEAGQDYCRQDPSEEVPDFHRAIDSIKLLGAGGTASGSNKGLALHTFDFESHPLPGDQTIYTVSFTLGTTDASVLDENYRCNSDNSSDDQWCAVNEFSFTARAGGREDIR